MGHCTICHQSFQDAYELCCGHSFHESCILALKKQKNSCPVCGKPINQKCFTAMKLFTMLDNLQCKSCKFPTFQSFRFTDTGVDLKYLFNHQCYDCQYLCHFFPRAPNQKEFVQVLLQHMEKLNMMDDLEFGKSLVQKPTRNYDQYDYLYCNTCDRAVIKFHAESKASLEKRAPTERVLEGKMDDYACPDCKDVTWATLREKTHQKLPTCGACHKLVKRHEWYERFCCRPQPFHLECSRSNETCPKCKTECTIQFEISKSDPTIKQVLYSRIFPMMAMYRSDEE